MATETLPAVIEQNLPPGWRPLSVSGERGWATRVSLTLLYDPDHTYGTVAAYEMDEPPSYVEVSFTFMAMPDWDWVRAYLKTCEVMPPAIRAEVGRRVLR